MIFQPYLPLADMKARLVLNRLSTEHVSSQQTHPGAAGRSRTAPKFIVNLTAEASVEELRRPRRC